MSFAGNAALAGSRFELAVDSRFGLLCRVAAVPGGRTLRHAEALSSDPSALGGARGPFRAGAAGLSRDRALAAAAERAVALYAAALYERAAFPLAAARDAGFPTVRPGAFALYGEAQLARPGFPYVGFDADTPVRWTSAVDLSDGSTVYVPASFVRYPYPWLREGGDLPLSEPVATGLACSASISAATLAGLYDVIAVDALAIFWQAAIAPPRLRVETLPERLRDLAVRVAGDDDLYLLDVTTDNRVPAFAAAAVSGDPGTPACVFGGAASLRPDDAVEAALLDLAESRRLARTLAGPAPSPANDYEDVTAWGDHLAFAADAGNRKAFDFALASDERHDLADYDRRSFADIDTELEVAVGRALSTGCRVYAANLSSEDLTALGLAVVRVLVPGHLPLFARHRARALGSERLYDVPRRLGHRGLARGSTGNPAPHPFFRGPLP